MIQFQRGARGQTINLSDCGWPPKTRVAPCFGQMRESAHLFGPLWICPDALREANGARGRNGSTGKNQTLSGVQPRSLTDGNPPSPAGALPNLSNSIPRSGVSPKTVLHLLQGDVGKARSERFWSYVDKRGDDQCWPWMGGVSSDGYGSFKLASYCTVTASRVALISSTQTEPAGLHVLHRCDNPRCCNPGHLRFGSIAQNMQDKVAKGRARGRFSRPVNPCLPKEADSRLTREKPCFCVSCSAERARNITGISTRFTGATPEPKTGAFPGVAR